MGVWLPLALADIFAALTALVRPWLKDPEALEIPTRADALATWCLPMMSKSLEAAQKERDAIALFKSVEKLKTKYGA